MNPNQIPEDPKPDVERMVALYGHKPSTEKKLELREALEKERGKFRRLEEYKVRSHNQHRSR